MINYNREPLGVNKQDSKPIYLFDEPASNIDNKTVQSFGDEWSKFSEFTASEIEIAGDQYFDIVPPEVYSGKTVLDIGCGTGRWSKYLANKAGWIESVDPSDAVFSASKLLQEHENIRISKAGVSNLPFDDGSFDFVFSLGVLHHIPDTCLAMTDCVKKVKSGGSFLVYLYYSLDNRGFLFKALFVLSNFIRKIVSALPGRIKRIVCDLMAVFFYMPFVLFSRLLKKNGFEKIAKYIPLSYYSDKSFRIIRNDSLDRFGTPLEQRFSRKEIIMMMESTGLTDIIVSDKEPYWHALGRKK